MWISDQLLWLRQRHGIQTDSNVGVTLLHEMIDIFPTPATLTGGAVRESCEGKNMEPILKDPPQKFRPYALTMYPRGLVTGFSLNNGRWRYTEWINKETKEVKYRELYDECRCLAGLCCSKAVS